MAILPESGHAKFLKFLDVSNTNQTMLIIIRIPNKSAWRNLSWKPPLLHCLKKLSWNSLQILQNGHFAWVRTCKISQISWCLKYQPNLPYFHQNTNLECVTKFELKSSTFTLPKATFLKYPKILQNGHFAWVRTCKISQISWCLKY